jgi:tellurite resistance protein TerC
VTESPWLWIGFNLLVLLMLALDLGVLHRKAKAVSLKEAIAWSVIWVLVALVFNVWVHYAAQHGWVQFKSTSPALDYFTGYLIERALSIDNIFVFLVLFTYFGVAPQFQYRVLFWGILGALVMRGLMIWLGVELIERFSWILYLFGAFLVWTGWKLLFQKGGEVHPEHNPVLKVARKFLRVTATYRDQAFFAREGGRWYATPMFLVLLVVETTDVAFALDSIPAIFAITQDPFIIYSSNVFAILGLRALYFLLAGVMPFFRFLNMGLAFVLMFIGVKMLLETAKLAHISTATSLGVVGGVLGMAVAASVIATKAEQNAQRRAAAVGNGTSSGPAD